MSTRDDRTPVTAGDGEATEVLGPAGDATRVLKPRADDATRVLKPRADGATRVLGPVDPTARVPGPGADGSASTVRLGPADAPEPGDRPGSGDADTDADAVADADSDADADADADSGAGDTVTVRVGTGTGTGTRPTAPAAVSDDQAEYSATVLASHWIQRPEPDAGLDGPPTTEILTARDPASSTPSPPTTPDRVDGTVLRFGPGVTAAVAHRTHRTLPEVAPPLAPPPPPPRRRLRRHALPALVLALVLAFLAWQRLGPPVALRAAAVTARPAVVGCDDTADLVGLVTTNGRPGTLAYRWVRSDGTASGVLREVVVRGQRQARLHLLWTFQGRGHRTARAELRLLSPTHRTLTADVTYDCS